MVEWRRVAGYEDSYEVSSTGQVRSLDRNVSKGTYIIHRKGKLLKPLQDFAGYFYVCLANSGKQKQKFIHVLVAEAFLPKPNYKVEVNHKDGDKSNNDVSNLEWVTHRYNIDHSFALGLNKGFSNDHMRELSKIGNRISIERSSIAVLCESDGLAFSSQNAADRFYGHPIGTLSSVLRRSNSTFRGRLFRKLLDSEKDDYTLLS